MAKKKVLVVGLGETGRPMFELVKESGLFKVYGFDVKEEKCERSDKAQTVCLGKWM